MASQGPLYPATVSTLSAAPESANDWLNPANVGANDAAEATITAATYDANDISFQLIASNFGFTIPAGATIDGIVVEIEQDIAAGAAVDNRVQLRDATGTLVGANKATATAWPAAPTIASYGGAADTWTASPTDTMVNDLDFGVVLSVKATAANTDVAVDFIRVTVYYTTGPVTATPTTAALTLATFAPTVIAGTYKAAVLADSPTAYWRMGEASGFPQDSAGTNHVTTSVGTLTYDAVGAITSDDDGAITFGGNAQFTAPDATALDLGDGPFSLELWAKRATTGVQTVLVGKNTSAEINNPVVTFETDNTIALFKAGVGLVVKSNVTVTDANWHHIVVTKNGAAVVIWLDKVDRTGTISDLTMASNAAPFAIGSDPGPALAFNGGIDEVAVYKSVLSSARVTAHYDAAAPSGTTATPTTASLVLSTFAPTVTATAHQTATPGVAALTLTTFAPVVKLTVTPATASLTLATFAPTVSATAHVTATPTVASLALTAFAPTVTASDHKTATPPTVALSLTTFAPTVTATTGSSVTATPGTASLTLAAFAPSVTASNHQVATPATATLALTALSPTVSATNHQIATPGVLALSLSAFAPTVAASNHQTATPGVASLAATTFAPTVAVSNHQIVVPGIGTLTLLTFAPDVSYITTVAGTATASVLATHTATDTVGDSVPTGVTTYSATASVSSPATATPTVT